MKKMKKLLPILLITAVTVIASILVYSFIYKHELDCGYDDLRKTAESVNMQIHTKFTDEHTKMLFMKEILLQKYIVSGIDGLEVMESELVKDSTVFSRIEIYDRARLNLVKNENDGSAFFTDFDGIFERGERMSRRYTDPVSGKECVCYIMPVEDGDEKCFVMFGVIELEYLKSYFDPKMLGDEGYMCVVDTRDGSFIADDWHKTLGNINDMLDRDMLPSYEEVDFVSDIKELKSGSVGFVSKTTGTPIYMHYTSIGIFDWELMVFVHEDVMFEGAYTMRNLLLCFAVVEILLIAVYCVFNMYIVNKLEKSNMQMESQKADLERLAYRDILTSMFNRSKFYKDMSKFQGRTVLGLGIAYIDMNGLKAINDLMTHEMGDKYLCDTAHEILEAFKGNSYRIGGDEFIVVVNDVSREEFDGRVSTMLENMAMSDIDVSIGLVYLESCDNVDEAVREAESLMYIEKDKYYKKNGERQRPLR